MARVEAVNPQVTHWTMTYFFQHQGIDEELQREEEKRVLIDRIKELGIIYGIFGTEVCPESGRIHLQIAFITTDRYRWQQMQVKFAPIHIEAMRKAAWRNKRYCKKDGRFIEIGQLPSGYEDEGPTANQIAAEVLKLAKENKIDEIQERFPAVYMRQRKVIHDIASEHEVWSPTGRRVCIWLYSKQYFQIGKSTFLATHFPYTRKKNYWHPQFQSDFWERYRGEETVIFDDLDATTPWLGSTLKRITSDTPLIVNQKFGSCLPMPKNIIVTSNLLPWQIWSNEVGGAVAARFIVLQGVRHCGRDLLVTPYEKPNVLFPISLINYLNNKGFNLIGNEEPHINDVDILGGSL